ncbi:hypothetical protein ACFRFJ_16260 [Streptomyces hydrogenans]|uniref:hypothetical protein n=1 Tax=Streptomyces hydrogenans TaxID=1873719 RepID=UPI0036CAD89D
MSTQTMLDDEDFNPTTDGGDEEIELVGDITDYWTFTMVRDWILLLPGITRTALHLYLLLRAMVSKTNGKERDLRRMSLDQLCWLLPGVNEKPASPTMVKDALRLLAEFNLVVNPEGERLITSTGKGGIQNALRKYKVNNLPPETYEGWRNVWDKLDAYTPDWRTNPPQPPVHTRVDDEVYQTPARPRNTAAPAPEQPEAKPAASAPAPKPRVVKAAAPAAAGKTRKAASAPPANTSPKKRSSKPAPQGEGSGASTDVSAAAPVVDAWAKGMRAGGHPFLPKRAALIAAEAAELLAVGTDLDHLCRVAEWMGRMKPSWKVLEDAMTWPDAPKPGIPAQQGSGRQAAIDACSRCDEYGQVDVDGRIAKCQHDAHPASAPAAGPAPTAEETESVVPERRLRDLIGALAQANA